MLTNGKLNKKNVLERKKEIDITVFKWIKQLNKFISLKPKPL